MVDKTQDALIDALKRAVAAAGEQRLFRSGKLAGLFPSRAVVQTEAAAQAMRDGLLEVLRTETKGKNTTEWVRPTPRAMEFLHEHESPVQVLKDLRELLQINRERVPQWLDEMQRQLQALSSKLTEEAQRWLHRLETLGQQVESALVRSEAGAPKVSGNAAADAPWAQDALVYLDHRRIAGAAGQCSLAELFAALREHHPELSVTDFHDRLRRLQDRKALRLLPFNGPASDIPEPEYALPEGTHLLYFATR